MKGQSSGSLQTKLTNFWTLYFSLSGHTLLSAALMLIDFFFDNKDENEYLLISSSALCLLQIA
jgi:hypothetical protein